jgi:tetratricopeptide (TPR) repeat protein
MMQGHAARKAGRHGEALDHFRSALEHDPESAEANSVYGLMLLQLGRAAEAEGPLRRAVDIAPSHAALRMNLAQWLAHEGRLGAAIEQVADVVAKEPGYWWAWERLGELKARVKNFRDASSHFGRAVELRPDDPSLLYKWARACFDDGRDAESERILGDAARLAPTHPAILRLSAELYESRGDWKALEKVANTWTAAHPLEHLAWHALAKARWETGYLQQAVQDFRTSLGLGGRNARNLAAFGRLCLSALEFESAATAIEEAEALDPDSSEMLSAKAVLLMFSGRYDEAQACCRRTIERNPDDASAFKTLAQLTNGRLLQDELAALRRLVARDDLRMQDRVTASFALADCLEAQADPEQSFAAYERANRLACEYAALEGIAYDRAARERQIDELIALFESVPAANGRDTAPRPVFIVGMPRSGTTLIESVIGGHSQVFACGERSALRWIMQDLLALARQGPLSGIGDSLWNQWRDFYWRQAPDIRGATVVTDKNPWNFDAIAVILRLFPDARIVHVRRNSVDTGLSVFCNQFPKTMPYANRLEDIGHYYGQYARLMAHWERVAAGRFTTVRYEAFVQEFDTAGPALLAACGLEWEKSCANFWEQRRMVSTLSTMQARRPLESRAGRAAAYTAQLGPLVNSLRDAGVDLENGEFLTPAQQALSNTQPRARPGSSVGRAAD